LIEFEKFSMQSWSELLTSVLAGAESLDEEKAINKVVRLARKSGAFPTLETKKDLRKALRKALLR
jgi:hypothetical protein